MTKTKLILLSLFFFLQGTAMAQHDFRKVDAWMSENTAKIGGRAILMVYKDGKIIYSHTVNDMNMRQKMIIRFMAKKQGKNADLNDYTPSSPQPVASSSKWLSAALLMTFVEEGKLNLNDSVGKYLPVLSKNGKGKITIGECLSHLTGIKAPPIKQNVNEMTDKKTMDDAIQYIAQLPVEGEPGKIFRYSNVGLQIAGAIIEKISRKSFNELFTERIAKPLNMRNTSFGKEGKVALPAGGAQSTAEDYLNFLVMIMNGGTFNGKQILSQKSITQMQINRITDEVKIVYSPAQATGIGYGFGEWVMKNDTSGKLEQYYSSPGLFGSFPWVDNNRHYAAFLMALYLDNDGRQERYAELKTLVDQAVH